MTSSPMLSAIVCDGMGWFSEVDYKRLLLTYDKVYYLFPKDLLSFADIDGKSHHPRFSQKVADSHAFTLHHFVPTEKLREVILAAAQTDASNPNFAQIVANTPRREQLYTWRIVNSDGDIGSGTSLGLQADQKGLAHAILLNKFLLAAEQLGCIPATGQPYVHALIAEKYRTGAQTFPFSIGAKLPALRVSEVNHFHVVSKVISSVVSDKDLRKRTEIDILRFKEKNRSLFERYSYTVSSLVRQISTTPLDASFSKDVTELVNTEFWKAKMEAEDELQAAWREFFKSAIVGAISGLVAVGITPFFSPGALTYASAVTASAAIAPWAVAELAKLIEAKRKAHEHGVYYLLKFKG